ncbi:prolyl oligopeptidase family serine peptidase [Flavobacterium plurextorum]|uniref:S9 family peptidase n=1 Tax=Flavobacterium TaxID=237 RepID=UPI00214D4125|nr:MULTISPECIES: prolyl oligopeptidase family serine peptidase [Flavobacterium]UUW08271.1 prolyl oligopeptidase family serine peptidase [Flavobacterium plurextorum]
MLTINDYKLWNLLIPDKISESGRWASYRIRYDYQQCDTLYVQTIQGHKKYVFPGGKEGIFNGELDFACITKDTLQLLNLDTGKLTTKARAVSFKFSKNRKFIAVIYKTSDQKFSLEIADRTGRIFFRESQITSYVFDPDLNGMLYATQENKKSGIAMLFFKDSVMHRQVLDNHTDAFQNLIWKKESVAFIENKPNNASLYSFEIKKNKLSILDPLLAEGYPDGMKISCEIYQNPIPSLDGTLVFFWIKEPDAEALKGSPEDVQIWNSKDRLITGYKNYAPFPKWADKMAAWNIKNGSVRQITTKELPSGFLSADYRHAFVYDPAAYEPQTRQNCPYDLYALDIMNGQKELISARYPAETKPEGSPDGKHLCYARDGHWWIYNISQNKSTCLTSGITASFFVEDLDRPAVEAYYGLAGWTENNEVMLYDKFDIWSISFDAKEKKRLTRGREIGKVYRIKAFDDSRYYDDTHAGKHLFDLRKGLLLASSSRDTGETGLSRWNEQSGMKDYLWEDRKISQISKAEKKDLYMFVEQSFVNAPRLMIYDSQAKEIFQSNAQQKHFLWGKNEPIEYMMDGKKVKAILFYPAEFEKGKKYPMVLRIYERQFSFLNDYQNPSLLMGTGFNVTNYTANGYFVLLPDIIYEYGNLKESVTKSLLSAVDAAVAKGDIEADRIGLIGHSFGGYETGLVITQTDRFAAAVAGAACTDLISTYLDVGISFGRPAFFRTENHQLRIGRSLFEDMPAYIQNSPVLLADKINTPLLGWTGEDDRQVNSMQSMEFYLAFRRLNKPHTLLIYPHEGHEIRKRENQIDLSRRVMEWFDHYLKNDRNMEWMQRDFKR